VLGRQHPLDEALRHGFAAKGRFAGMATRDRAFARLLAATVLRRLGQIDAALAQCLERPLAGRAKAAEPVLRLGAAQLLFLATPPHAAVDAAVRQLRRHANLAGLANAVLRRLAREGADIVAAQDAVRLNCPEWLWLSWCRAHGEAPTRAVIAQLLAEPPLDLSVKADASAWAERLGGVVLPTGGVRLAGGGPVEALAGYGEGAWWVQDAAAALPARLLGPIAGRPVLDLCAAPGGKTLQLAAAGAQVTAVDQSEARLGLVRENLRRCGLEAELIAADLRAWRPDRRFELILLDAPCSATGTIRRHPDVWRLKTPAEVARMAAIQRELAESALAMLAPGGRLVFGTCSLEPEEGEAIAEALLKAHAGLRRQPVQAAEIGGLAELLSPAGDLRTLPCHLAGAGGLDGFYACRLSLAAA
jgi:16S rRNA (cytosine967-C5)-methyltransferase